MLMVVLIFEETEAIESFLPIFIGLIMGACRLLFFFPIKVMPGLRGQLFYVSHLSGIRSAHPMFLKK